MPNGRQWEAASESDGRVAVEREAVIRPWSERGRLAQASVEDAVHRLGVSRTLIYRLVGRYESTKKSGVRRPNVSLERWFKQTPSND